MCANGGSSHCCQLLLYCPPKRRPHKATLGRPTWKRGQLKSLSLANAHSKERAPAPKFSPGESLSLRCSFLPPLSLDSPFSFPSRPLSFLFLSLSLSLSLSLALSLFCSLTNHPYLNVCNGIGLMPPHRRGGERYRDKGQVERWVSEHLVRNDL